MTDTPPIATPSRLPSFMGDPEWWVGEFAVTRGPRSMRVDNDLEAVQLFLAARAGNRNTLSLYTKEINRLLVWCKLVQGKPLSGLDYGDILMFNAWLANPGHEFIAQDRELAGQGRLLFYKKGLAASSAKTAMRVVAALFNELEIGGYLSVNPVRLFMRHQKGRGSGQQRRREPMPSEMRDAVEEWLGSLPFGTEKAEYGALVAALLYMGLRASEAAEATLDAFHVEEFKGERFFAITVTGKRGKTREIPVEDRAQKAFELYRLNLGLSMGLDDRTPREEPNGPVPRLLGLETRSGVYYRVKAMCKKIVAYLDEKEDPRGNWFRQAAVYPHRFRHTATRRWLDKDVGLRAVQDTLGHASITTTSIYDNTPVGTRLKEFKEKVG